jgi:hypothetical protein
MPRNDPSTVSCRRSNPPAVVEPPFPHVPAIAFLAVDALQMGGELVAQLVQNAAGFGASMA